MKVNEHIFLAGFYIIDMDDDYSVNSYLILLGRPFTSTVRTKIDVHEGTLSVEFDGNIVTIIIFYAMRYSKDIESVNYVGITSSIVQTNFEQNFVKDKLKFVLQHSKIEVEVELEDEEAIQEAIMTLQSLLKFPDRLVNSNL